jgi:hypothetical protein
MMVSILFCGLTLWTLIISQTDNINDGIHFILWSDIMDPHHFSDRQY